jgi:putative transposase
MMGEIIELLPGAGHRTIAIKLKEKGFLVNKKRVIRIMKENNLVSKKVNKFKLATTNSNHGFKKYKNILKGKKIKTVNQAIVGDVSQFSHKGKDFFIATLMDLCNREIIGCSISRSNNTELVLKALEDAVATRGIKNLNNCIHHTDADVRYCSTSYTTRLNEIGIKISMCVGNAYENAHAESLFKTIKYQEINISEYKNEKDMVEKILSYVVKYNTIRPHSALNYMSPVKYKKFLLGG